MCTSERRGVRQKIGRAVQSIAFSVVDHLAEMLGVPFLGRTPARRGRALLANRLHRPATRAKPPCPSFRQAAPGAAEWSGSPPRLGPSG